MCTDKWMCLSEPYPDQANDLMMAVYGEILCMYVKTLICHLISGIEMTINVTYHHTINDHLCMFVYTITFHMM